MILGRLGKGYSEEKKKKKKKNEEEKRKEKKKKGRKKGKKIDSITIEILHMSYLPNSFLCILCKYKLLHNHNVFWLCQLDPLEFNLATLPKNKNFYNF